jgi:hypothetical protein
MTDESQREIVIHAGSLRGDVVEGLKLPTVLDLEFHVAPIVADSDIEIPVDFIGAFSDDAFDSDLYGAAFANIYVLYFPFVMLWKILSDPVFMTSSSGWGHGFVRRGA